LAVGVVLWLRQGERDRDAEEIEGLPLGAGRLGEHGDGGGGAGEADLVAGQVKVSGAHARRRC
jgi:hypothetical protein